MVPNKWHFFHYQVPVFHLSTKYTSYKKNNELCNLSPISSALHTIQSRWRFISVYRKVHHIQIAHPFILAYMGTKFLIFNNISTFTTFHATKWEFFKIWSSLDLSLHFVQTKFILVNKKKEFCKLWKFVS